MFDTLTDKFSSVFRNLSGRGKISEENIRESMREVRTALLEADVNFQVVKEFTERVVQKALGQNVIASLQPGQNFTHFARHGPQATFPPSSPRCIFARRQRTSRS